MGQISMGLFQAVREVIGFGAFLAFVAIFNFYLLLDKDRVEPFVINSIPPKYRKQAVDILKKMDTALGDFLRGQLIVALMVGLMFALGLFLIGVLGFATLTKFSLLIGTAAGICGIIPYFGSIMGVTPALVIVLFSATAWETKIIGFLLVAGIFIVIQAIEGMVLQPKILGKGAAPSYCYYVGPDIGFAFRYHRNDRCSAGCLHYTGITGRILLSTDSSKQQRMKMIYCFIQPF